MDQIFPSSHQANNLSNSSNLSPREQLIKTYLALRGALHSASSWTPTKQTQVDRDVFGNDDQSEEASLTYGLVGTGFTGKQAMAAFCMAFPKHPLSADYINRFNNVVLKSELAADVDSHSIHETITIKTLWDTEWQAWMLPPHVVNETHYASIRPLTPLTLTLNINAKIRENSLLSVNVFYDILSLVSQLIPSNSSSTFMANKATRWIADDWAEVLPRVNARLLRPNRVNALSSVPSATIKKENELNLRESLKMTDLLTDLSLPTPRTNKVSLAAAASFNPALRSRPEALFVTSDENDHDSSHASVSRKHGGEEATPARQPASKSLFLTDGSAEKPQSSAANFDNYGASPTAASRRSQSGPMGTLLDEPVKQLPSRGLTAGFQDTLFKTHSEDHSPSNTVIENRPGYGADNQRFASSIFATTLSNSSSSSLSFANSDIPHQDVKMQSESMKQANASRFGSSIATPEEALALELNNKNATNNIVDDVVKKSGNGFDEARETGVLFGQATPLKARTRPPTRFDANASQISFDYYQ